MSGSRSRLANAAHVAMLQRSELQRRLGVTQKALTPGSLKDRGKFHVKSAASDAADFARAEARNKRTLLGLGAVAGALWIFREPIKEKGPVLWGSASIRVKNFLASVNRGIDPFAEEGLDTDEATKTAKRKRDRIAEKLSHKRDQARNALSKLWPAAAVAGHQIQDKVDDNMKPISETAHDAREKATELAEKAAESARHTAEAAKARVQDGYGRAREVSADLAAKGREQAGAAKEAASAALVKGKEQAKVAGSRLRDFADEQPLTLVAGALAAGLLIGTLISGNDETK
jgi:hypothetical protein